MTDGKGMHNNLKCLIPIEINGVARRSRRFGKSGSVVGGFAKILIDSQSSVPVLHCSPNGMCVTPNPLDLCKRSDKRIALPRRTYWLLDKGKRLVGTVLLCLLANDEIPPEDNVLMQIGRITLSRVSPALVL